jgi:DNA transposition AAA+ family ATPase
MSDVTEDNGLDAEAQERIRVEVRRLANGRPMTRISEEAGVPYGTWSGWMGGTYAGNTSKIAGKAQMWIDAQAAKTKALAGLRQAPGFVETPTARAIITLLQQAQFATDLVIVSGGSGLGKSTALERYKATTPNVWLLTGEPCFSTPRMVLDCLAEKIGITERYSSQTVSRAITASLRDTGGLLIVDEAQHLSDASLDQLRSQHDLAQVGVAFVGNDLVADRFAGFGRKAQFAQLSSRVGMRLSRAKPTKEDLNLVLDAWGIEGAELRAVLIQIGQRPGGQRNVKKTLQLALLAAGAGALTVDLVRRGYEQITGSRLLLDAAA